eukprot:CAMPEP_0174245982 /NCGR_PEP_ID=MMETSP0417-20130205/41656_1 /TAXON_ID=242541 /ORGANISM="Mayorella sp, Strain BSH-02190019" /LENGTH=712 /DNA_ID=CAMNT_0015325823 /DNA_START=77 /DNA_END=2212 /DNA_ORIENTATION=+
MRPVRSYTHFFLLLALLLLLLVVDARAVCPTVSVLPGSGTVISASNQPTVLVVFSEDVTVLSGGVWTSLRTLGQMDDAMLSWMQANADPATGALPISLYSDVGTVLNPSDVFVDSSSISGPVLLLDFANETPGSYFTIVVRGDTFQSARNPQLFVQSWSDAFYTSSAQLGPCLQQQSDEMSQARCVDVLEFQAPAVPSPVPSLAAWERNVLETSSLIMALARDPQGNLELYVNATCTGPGRALILPVNEYSLQERGTNLQYRYQLADPLSLAIEKRDPFLEFQIESSDQDLDELEEEIDVTFSESFDALSDSKIESLLIFADRSEVASYLSLFQQQEIQLQGTPVQVLSMSLDQIEALSAARLLFYENTVNDPLIEFRWLSIKTTQVWNKVTRAAIGYDCEQCSRRGGANRYALHTRHRLRARHNALSSFRRFDLGSMTMAQSGLAITAQSLSTSMQINASALDGKCLISSSELSETIGLTTVGLRQFQVGESALTEWSLLVPNLPPVQTRVGPLPAGADAMVALPSPYSWRILEDRLVHGDCGGLAMSTQAFYELSSCVDAPWSCISSLHDSSAPAAEALAGPLPFAAELFSVASTGQAASTADRWRLRIEGAATRDRLVAEYASTPNGFSFQLRLRLNDVLGVHLKQPRLESAATQSRSSTQSPSRSTQSRSSTPPLCGWWQISASGERLSVGLRNRGQEAAMVMASVNC